MYVLAFHSHPFPTNTRSLHQLPSCVEEERAGLVQITAPEDVSGDQGDVVLEG